MSVVLALMFIFNHVVFFKLLIIINNDHEVPFITEDNVTWYYLQVPNNCHLLFHTFLWLKLALILIFSHRYFLLLWTIIINDI